MTDWPAIPYTPDHMKLGGSHYGRGHDKRWVRKLAEAGKLTSPGKYVRKLLVVNWRDKPQGSA